MANVKNKMQKAKITELEENWKRALADYQNLVKRVEADKAEITKLASLNVVNKLLPTLDVLELAASHSHDEGIQMAVGQFRRLLQNEGLEEISPAAGGKFDPALHECVEKIDGQQAGTIAEVLRKGYKINGFTLRPARVKVWQTK